MKSRSKKDVSISDSTYLNFENACRHGETSRVNQLLEKYGSDVAKRHAIHDAVKGGHPAIMHILIDKGAKINSLDPHGWTAVHYAAYHNHVDILASLCESYPQEVQRKTRSGLFHGAETLLHVAARGAASEALKWIIDKKYFDINVCDQNNDTALHWAVRKRAENCVLYLIANGANINAVNNQNFTPFDSKDPLNESASFKEFKSKILRKAKNPAALRNALNSDKSDYHECRIL